MTAAPTAGTAHATSADGTRIAYEAGGSGPALVLVDGALCHRGMGPSKDLAKGFATDFTVHAYDRRDRGDSDAGNAPWSLARELEDLAAVIDAAGGSAHVLGVSSGGVIALAAAAAGLAIGKVVVYEAPLSGGEPVTAAQLRALVDDDRRADAVRTFMRAVGVPAPFVSLMRLMPAWKQLTAVAHTLPHDLAIVEAHVPITPDRFGAVRQPVLVLAGAKSPEPMRTAQAAIAAGLPDARLETLPGQTHMVKAKATCPPVAAFLRE